MKKFDKGKLKNLIIFVMSLGIILFLFAFLLMGNQIGSSVERNCFVAQEKYTGDCVEALISSLDDKKNSFESRNSAIWALGQLGDIRALPVLKKYYTGDIPEREPIEEGISQYELKKAINLAGGGVNLSAWVWRNGDFE